MEQKTFKEFFNSRKETASAQAGQTKIYTDKGSLLASHLLGTSYIVPPQTRPGLRELGL